MNDLEPFAKLVLALRPWSGQLIFIGGWGHRLCRYHPLAGAVDYPPVFTRDTDLAFGSKEPIEGDIKQALAKFGFQEQLSGDLRPPAAHYSLGDENQGFYAEFLTPLTGSGMRRSGEPDATMAKAGIYAQKIRYLDVLLVDPWVVRLDPSSGIPLPEPMDVLVANPLCFMIQKFLIQHHRTAKKRAQDVLYIHDTIELFGGQMDQLRECWQSQIAPRLGKQAEVVRRVSKETFGNLNDMTREAAQIPQDRKLRPEEVQAKCQYALGQILGS